MTKSELHAINKVFELWVAEQIGPMKDLVDGGKTKFDRNQICELAIYHVENMVRKLRAYRDHRHFIVDGNGQS